MTLRRAHPAPGDPARGGIVRGAAGLLLALTVLLAFAPPAGAQSVPGAVVNLQVLGGDRVAFWWQVPESDGGSPITGYRLRQRAYSDGVAGEWSGYTALPARPRRLEADLDGGTTFDVEVQALNAQGAGPGTIIKVHARPPAPVVSLVHASPDTSALKLSWSPVTAPGTPLTGYVWGYRTEFPNSISGHWTDHSVPLTTTEVTVTGLAPRTRYAFWVYADTPSRSGYSGTATGWTRTAATVQAVTPVTLTTGAIQGNGNRATLRFTLSRQCWADPNQQLVCGAGSWNAGAAVSHFSVTGLPGVAVESVSNRSGRSIDATISYDGSEVDTDATLRFQIAPGAHDDDNTIAASIHVTATDTDALPVVSVADITVPEGSFEQTGFSRTITIRVTPTPNQDIRYRWGTHSRPGDTASGHDYSYFAVDDGPLWTLSANRATHTITFLVYGDTIDEDDETFTFTLADLSANARFAGGGTTLSAKVTIVDNDTRAGAPTGLSAEAGTNPGEVVLDWTAPEAPGVLDGSAATIGGYQYRTATTNAGLSGARWWHTNSASPSFTVTGLATGEHHFQVRAVTGVPGGAVSGSASATVQATGATGPPSVPARLKLISIGPTGFRVWWEASTLPSGSRGTIEYDFQWKPNTRSGWPTAFLTSTERGPHIDSPGRATGEDSSNLAFGEDYDFRVRACIQGSSPRNCSAWSDPLLMDTPRVLGLVTSTNPATLTEDNLDGATLTARLSWAEWVASPSADDVTVTGIPGLRVSEVARQSQPRWAIVTLDFDGTDFDADATLGLTIAPAAHTGANTVTVQGAPTVTAVVEPPNRPATGAPSIGGVAQVGRTLTAVAGDIADADGLDNVSWSWQWIRVETDGTEKDIDGETQATYTVVDADLGRRLKVRVHFTDDARYAEMRTSAATVPVTPAPVPVPVATLALEPVTIDESGPNNAATLRATFDTALPTAATLTVSAAPPGVVILDSTTLTIPAGETESTGGGIRVTAVDNDVASGADATVTLSATAPAGVTAPAPVTLTVAEDDAAPVPAATLTLEPDTIDESGPNNAATLRATFDTALPTAATLTVSAAPPGVVTLSGTTLAIPPNETESTGGGITVTAVDDNVASEADATVTLSATTPAGVTAPAPVTLTVVEDDAAPPTIPPPTVPRGLRAAQTTESIRIAWDASTYSGSEDVVYTSERRASGNGDPWGETETGRDTDRLFGGLTPGTDYDFRVRACAAGTGECSGYAQGTFATLAPPAAVATLALAPLTIDESGPNNAATLRATLDIARATVTTLTVSATPPGVVTLDSTTLTIPAGETESTGGGIRVTAVDDNVASESDATVTLSATAPTGVTVPALVTLTVVEDDAAPATMALSVHPTVVSEDGTATEMTVTAAFPPGSATLPTETAVTVQVGASGRKSDHTAIPGTDAVPGTDYESVGDITVTIPARRTRGTRAFTFTPIQDTDDSEGLETVSVTGSTARTAVEPAVLTVADRGTRVLSLADASAPEGAPVTFTVTLSGRTLDRDLELVARPSSESGDTATAGTDYATAVRSVTLPAQRTSATFSVATTQDGDVEPDETFTVTLSARRGTTLPDRVMIADARATGTIADDDGASVVHHIPLFVSASDSLGRRSFARIINDSDEAGEVRIDAFDDEGTQYGPVTLSIAANETVHFNSDDLETGNLAKGLAGATGAGEGRWRLELTSDLDIRVLSYLRTDDGFVTSMHDLVPRTEAGHHVVFFNPGSNRNQISRLRLINRGAESAEVTIEGIDGDGESPGTAVRLSVPSGGARTVTARELESEAGRGEAVRDLAGALGDGAGKWRLVVRSDRPVEVMSLLSSPTGHLTNLSTAPGGTTTDDGRVVHHIPWFAPASDPLGRQSFARIINDLDEADEVRIDAFDDAGTQYGPVTLSIAANETVHLNSDDLESGNAGKGLAGATGRGEGRWRLELTSGPGIQVLGYLRTDDGFVTSVHDLVPRTEAGHHHVVFFNPGSNANQVSRLRLVNRGAESAEVTIEGIDDDGESPGMAVRLSVSSGGARAVTAQELESEEGRGEAVRDLTGALGDGAGKWRLEVASDRAIDVMSLLASPTGHLTNLSTAPGAPAR